MIENATILYAASPSTSPAGDTTYLAGPALDVRACLSGPTFLQRQKSEAMELEATAALFSPVPLARGARVAVRSDDEQSGRLWLVLHVTHHVHPDGLSHYECLVRNAE